MKLQKNDIINETPLSNAIKMGNKEIVRKLLTYSGINLNQKIILKYLVFI